MGEIWGAAIAVGGAVISGYAKNKQAKEDRKNAKADAKEMSKEDAQYGAVLSRFEAEQDDYYSQLNRQRKQRGLDQFRQFSTMHQFAPTYTDTNRIEVPSRPDVNAIIAETIPEEAAVQQEGGKKKGILSKIDPLGSKLIKADPIGKKLLGGLF